VRKQGCLVETKRVGDEHTATGTEAASALTGAASNGKPLLGKVLLGFKRLPRRFGRWLLRRAEVIKEIIMRIVLWLILGILINVIPVFINFIAASDAQAKAGGSSLTSALASGDLLIATTAILPPALADLALNAKKAKRARVVIIVMSAVLVLFALLLYALAFANAVARESGRAEFPRLTTSLVAQASIGFFGSAVIIGGVVAAFIAVAEHNASGEKDKREREQE
jgi:hypothetical protein